MDPRHDVTICKELFANVVLSGGTTFFQGIGKHMNGPTVLPSSTMRSKWFYRGRTCHSLRLPFFSPSTQGQLPARCKIFCVASELVFHSYSHVIRTDCPKKENMSVITVLKELEHFLLFQTVKTLVQHSRMTVICFVCLRSRVLSSHLTCPGVIWKRSKQNHIPHKISSLQRFARAPR